MLQQFQNGVIQKFIHKGQNNDRETSEQLHGRYKLGTLKMRKHRRAVKTWEKFDILEELAQRSMAMNTGREQQKDHYWWKRVATYINKDNPEAMYKE